MELSALNNQSALSAMQQMCGTSSNTSSLEQISHSVLSSVYSTSGTDTANITQLGQIFSNLQKLKAADPDQFKQLMTSEAEKLQTAASKAGATTSNGQLFSTLAQSFQDVASGGSLVELHPFVLGSLGNKQVASMAGTYNQSGQSSAATTSQSASETVASVLADLEQAASG